MRRQESGGTVIYRWKVFERWEDRFVAGLTTRVGGTGGGPFESLNLGHASGSEPQVLAAHRRIVETALNLNGFSWSVAKQVHGCRIAAASPRDSAAHPDTDALEVRTPGVIAAVMLADCHPIILFDPERRAALVCHAGWRGTSAGMADAAVEAMIRSGSRLETLAAATGPGIGSCCYQVGEDLRMAFEEAGSETAGIFRPDKAAGKWRLDLEAANLARLRRAGIREENLGSGGFCTSCRPDEFYSWRKEKGLTERHAAIVALLPD